MILKEILKESILKLNENNIGEPNFISRRIISDILKIPKEYFFNKENEEISKDNIEKIRRNIEKIIEGIPIQYITNKQEFMGLEFYVDENVLVPRADTEILVEEVIKIVKENFVEKEKIEILDLCTGSGAIGISIAKYVENAKVTLVDISKEALKIAEKNSKDNMVLNKCELILSNMFNNLKNKKFDIIVSNPPYIETKTIEDLSIQVKKEPIIALDGGEDGNN